MLIRDVRREEINKVWELIKDKSFDLKYEDIEESFDKSEKMIAFEDINIGFALIRFLGVDDKKKKYEIGVFINPKFRLNGYGALLVNHLENSINKERSPELTIENMLKYHDASEFLIKTGYNMWYSSSLMVYPNGLFSNVTLDLIPYEDKYYKEYVKLRDDAFYQISIENNMIPNSSSNSTTLRGELIETADEHSLLVIDEQLIGVVQVTKDHVSRVMVVKSARGKGYGNSLVKYATNRIIYSGLEPKLFIMDTNIGARKLYETIGYNLISTVHVYRKTI